MKTPDDWVRILAAYGPNAILVFFVFVTERKIWKAMKEAPEQDKKKLVGVYIANWVLIFGVAIFAMVAYWQLNLVRKPQISGRLENLSNSEILSTSFDDLYLRRIRQADYSNYEWLLINKDKQYDEGETIVFTIDRSEENHENSFDYELPIRSDFYKKGVYLRRDQDDLYFVGQKTPLTKRRRLLSSPPKPSPPELSMDFFTTTTYAQEQQKQFSIEASKVGLESPDVLVRRNSRSDLANQNQADVLPWIDSVLKDSNSSYRLRLGVIVALNNMPNLPVEVLMPATIDAIQRGLNDPDSTLRNEAYSLARRYKLIPLIVYEDIDFSGKSQVFGPGKYRADKLQLGSLPNDSASSYRVAKGFRVRLCENEGSGNGGGICEEKFAGNYPLTWGPSGLADKVSFIQVISLKTPATE
ncbi:MAG TPA: HEAT repeat domain-containing protein [Pyrinomonadaceae bacterium]|jgi:hypothetical protein|nr:HEAT repeat domain-containing protein [Pyrinomonadaceae bacterium]